MVNKCTCLGALSGGKNAVLQLEYVLGVLRDEKSCDFELRNSLEKIRFSQKSKLYCP